MVGAVMPEPAGTRQAGPKHQIREQTLKLRSDCVLERRCGRRSVTQQGTPPKHGEMLQDVPWPPARCQEWLEGKSQPLPAREAKSPVMGEQSPL